jgi:hypothetical protein
MGRSIMNIETDVGEQVMNEYEKLEYIHHIIQECMNNNIDMAMLETALEFVEDIREPYLWTMSSGERRQNWGVITRQKEL